jgi:hypothetical protein
VCCIILHYSSIRLTRLKDQQSSLETSIDAVNRGDAAPKRNRKWRNLEARLLRLKEEYVNGIRNLEKNDIV